MDIEAANIHDDKRWQVVKFGTFVCLIAAGIILSTSLMRAAAGDHSQPIKTEFIG